MTLISNHNFGGVCVFDTVNFSTPKISNKIQSKKSTQKSREASTLCIINRRVVTNLDLSNDFKACLRVCECVFVCVCFQKSGKY